MNEVSKLKIIIHIDNIILQIFNSSPNTYSKIVGWKKNIIKRTTTTTTISP
jgi:hypothetical protein